MISSPMAVPSRRLAGADEDGAGGGRRDAELMRQAASTEVGDFLSRLFPHLFALLLLQLSSSFVPTYGALVVC